MAILSSAGSFDTCLQHCPELYQSFRDFQEQIWAQPYIPVDLLELCRLRIAQLHNSASDLSVRSIYTLAPSYADVKSLEQKIALLSHYQREDLFTPGEIASLQLAELFVIDPSCITDELADDVITHYGDAGYVALLEALGHFDGCGRFKLQLGCGPATEALGYVASDSITNCNARAVNDSVIINRPAATKVSVPRVQAETSNTGSMVRDSALNLVPTTLETFLAFYQQLWHNPYLRAAELEVARLRNAALVNCTFCKATRFDLAVDDGLQEAEASAALAGTAETGRLLWIIRITEAFLNYGKPLSDEDHHSIEKEFSVAELVTLVTGLSLFMSFSKFAVAMGGLPEELPVMKLPVPA